MALSLEDGTAAGVLPTCTGAFETLQTIPIQFCRQDLQIRFQARPGLHQFSVVADAGEFDWEELYENLTKYNNTGQRTGPWDFKLGPNTPLVPAYWVFLNERKLGLWYFQRVSLEDLEARRFRGRIAFDIEAAGEVELRFVPYREFKLRWISATLEPDPEDVLEELALEYSAPLPAQQWAGAAFWAGKREELQTTHALFREPLCRSFDWAMQGEDRNPDDILLLLAAHRLDNHPGAREAMLEALDYYIELPHWGNPQEDGYGHDGDMGASAVLRVLAWCYHALGEELGDERRVRLLDKLALQGARFYNSALLNRDYWGGSVLQDHGWKSVFAFGAATLHLLGVLPQAQRWAQWLIPRLRRCVNAMPRDGVIPTSSHKGLHLYVAEPTYYRDALLAQTGHDIFDDGPFHELVDYVAATMRQKSHPLLGGNHFFNRIAQKYSDGRAAKLQKLLLQNALPQFPTYTMRRAFYHDALHGSLSYSPAIETAELPRLQPLIHYRDSGQIYYYDEAADLSFALHCGPWVGFHADRNATGPCDRMGNAPGAGHFIIRRGSAQLLMTPDGGYSLHSAVRSVLLIDGRGQHGSIGYPMSIPSYRYRGEEILFARWNESTRRGHIRLNLAPAYPDELQLAAYTRDFLLEPNRIVCRDHIVLQQPGVLSWLFQSRCADGLKRESNSVFRFGNEQPLRLEAQSPELELQSGIHPTEVVWSYASTSGYRPFDHARFDTTAPAEKAFVDFVMTWD